MENGEDGDSKVGLNPPYENTLGNSFSTRINSIFEFIFPYIPFIII